MCACARECVCVHACMCGCMACADFGLTTKIKVSFLTVYLCISKLNYFSLLIEICSFIGFDIYFSVSVYTCAFQNLIILVY